jgi:TonB-dependent receptor
MSVLRLAGMTKTPGLRPMMITQRCWAVAAVAAGLVFQVTPAEAQGSVTLAGTVKDFQSGEVLPGANVVLVGTGFGGATDSAGNYAIQSVGPGEYSVKISYVGYQSIEMRLTVDVSAAGTLTRNYTLHPIGVQSETIIVTAQANSQSAAINQQLDALPVMNVVSAEKIQELPSVTAADAVGRLPGIALIRVGGEGSQVIIRGMAPQYNQVTIEGVELPTDIPSSNNITSVNTFTGTLARLGDRAQDLSIVSSSMLGGIEVIKAITPDMDATMLGGVVNFTFRRAALSTPEFGRNQSWIPFAEVLTEGGFNQLKNTKNDYRIIGSIENRFFDESFGVFLHGTIERRNLSDNTMGASLMLLDKAADYSGVPVVGGISVDDNFRSRERKGATLVLDYQHTGGELGFISFFSSSLTRTATRSIDLPSVEGGNAYFGAVLDDNTINVFSNLFSLKQDLPWFHVDVKLSQSLSENLDPEELAFTFRQRQALSHGSYYLTLDPEFTMSSLVLDPSRAGLGGITTTGTTLRERVLSGYLDLQQSFSLAEGVTGTVKLGGMVQRRAHEYDYTMASGSGDVGAMLRALPSLGVTGRSLSATTFYDPSYFMGMFLHGQYPAPYPINVDLMEALLPIGRGGILQNTFASTLNNYEGYETKSAGYVMATFALGDLISFLPGARYQNMTTHYTAYRGMEVFRGYQGKDTTVSVPHGMWLPMIHVRYQPTDWLQLRAAYTKTLMYSDYSTLTPRSMISSTFTVAYNNFNIKPATSENLDLVVALHSREIGLLSFNGFRKRIQDLVFFSQRFLSDLKEFPDLPQTPGPLYELSTYINSRIPVDLYGLETEWQTNFWYLPGFLSHLVLDVNFTHIFSEANYPKSVMNIAYADDGSFTRMIADTFYTARLLNQPNDILNLMLGYDVGGLSAHVSLLFQDNIFRNPDFWPQLRTMSGKYARWDLSVRQELPWAGMQVYFNVNNLSAEDDITNNTQRDFPVAIERYGMSASAGLRIRL